MSSATAKLENLDEWNSFDISKYTTYSFNINRRRKNIVYYRCRLQPVHRCPATCKAQFIDKEMTVRINFTGEHNHAVPVPVRAKLARSTTKQIVSLMQENPDQKPSVVARKITEQLTNEELRDTKKLPSRRQISYIKSKFIGESFPTQDHIWNCILAHGDFEGASRFIRIFSLVPLVVIFSTEEGLKRLNGYSGALFVDSTHSTAFPHLICFV